MFRVVGHGIVAFYCQLHTTLSSCHSKVGCIRRVLHLNKLTRLILDFRFKHFEFLTRLSNISTRAHYRRSLSMRWLRRQSRKSVPRIIYLKTLMVDVFAPMLKMMLAEVLTMCFLFLQPLVHTTNQAKQ